MYNLILWNNFLIKKRESYAQVKRVLATIRIYSLSNFIENVYYSQVPNLLNVIKDYATSGLEILLWFLKN